jgi:hypothetical protein
MSLADTYQGTLKKCPQCDDTGIHWVWDGNSGRNVPHDMTWEAQTARRRAIRAAYHLPSTGAFLSMWWGFWLIGVGLFIGLACQYQSEWGIGTVVWSIIMILAWCWYDWCEICLHRWRGDHTRCSVIRGKLQ